MRRFLAALLAGAVLSLGVPSTAESATPKKNTQQKKKGSPRKAAPRRAAPARRAPAAPVAVGATFEERLSSLVNGSVASSGDSSVTVVEVDSGRLVAQRNSTMLLAPASNMKLFTTAAGTELLGSNFPVRTVVYMRGTIDPSGTLDGDLKIVGHGDPTIGGRFHDGKATAVIQQWATDLRNAGIKTVKGNLIFDHGYFDSEYIHPTWPVDQLVNWYEAPVSAFSMQENCIQVRILPGRSGERCIVQLDPPTSFVQVENSCVTGRGLPFVTRVRGTNRIIVRGGVPARSGATEIFVTIENPVHYFATATAEALQRSGVTLQGQIILTTRDERTDWRPVTEHSTPLSTIVYVINKKSQNHYAEQLIKMLGAEKGNEGSWAGGNRVVSAWMQSKVGIGPDQFQPVDGSGMSRNNRASSHAFIELLRYMWRSPYREEFLSSLPYSGDPDSKFGHRLRNPPYARQVYAKTGYIGGVVGLSGYVRGKSGKVYAFSFLFNRYRVGVYAIYNLQDAMLKEIVNSG